MPRQVPEADEPVSREYEVTPRRVLLALPAGALVGGLLLTVFIYVFHSGEAPNQWASMQTMFLISVMTASVFFAVGLLFLGVPLWLLLDRLRWRSAPIFSFAGAVLMLIVLRPPLANMAPMAVLGALVAFTVWRIAYRKN
jgi:hypothetical protein